MMRERFAGMADAYGGEIDRWPVTDQPAARAFLNSHRADAAEILAAAAALDGLLAASPEPLFSGVVRERILGAADKPQIRRGWTARTRWVSGIGLAAACAAGVVFGSSLSGQIIGDPALDALDQASTSFDAAYSLDLEDAG